MALPAGTRIGSYEVLGVLGEGGMGQVYRARDTKLKRDVALKVLPPDVAEDPARLARFQREAETLASLNHPHIAQIYGVEDRALVMELVTGEDLSVTLARGPLAVSTALPIARQIADALEAAHEAGIIHRDLKPANVKLRTDGTVKVLDFGLAKTTAPPEDLSALETATSPAVTMRGVIVGTPAYMSPEQARGLVVDKRADIWAFGVVLFELLTGRRLFTGDSTTDVLAAVVREVPDFSALPADTPPSIRRLLKRCLEKDRKKRLPDIGVARLEIDDASAPETSAVAPAPQRPSRLPWLVVAAALAALAAALAWGVTRRAAAPIEWAANRLGGAEVAMGPRVSPDGQLVAFLAMVDGMTQVAVMKPETGNWTVLTRGRAGIIMSLCWSKDSARVYFDRMTDAPQGIFSVPVLGGDEQIVIEDAMSPDPLPDGSFLVQRLDADRRYQLYRVWPETGRTQGLKFLIPWTHGSPPFRATPAGDRVVVLGRPLEDPSAAIDLHVMDLASERATRVPGVSIPPNGAPVAVAADGLSAVIVTSDGDADRVLRVPLNGRSPVATLLTLMNHAEYLDVGKDGAIYVDQRERPTEVFRVAPDGRALEHLAEVAPLSGTVALSLPDGRVLANTRIGGRDRIMLAALGKDMTPFIDTQEQTARPLAIVGDSLVALMVGADANRTIALASIANRRIIRRLEGAKGMTLDTMVAAPDGRTLYFAAAGSIWSIPVDDGTPKQLRKGDSVTIDPYRNQLIVRLTDIDGTRLVRQPLAGGPEEPIVLTGGLPLAPWQTWSTAVARDGSIIVPLASPESWFWPLGVVDPNTGRTRVLDLDRKHSDMAGGWTPDGKIMVNAMGLRSTMWRFVPMAATAK